MTDYDAKEAIMLLRYVSFAVRFLFFPRTQVSSKQLSNVEVTTWYRYDGIKTTKNKVVLKD